MFVYCDDVFSLMKIAALCVLGLFLQHSSLRNISTFAGNITDEFPAFNEIWLFALQSDNTLIRSLLKILLLVKTLLRLLV